jgi:hypothetical protein
MKAKLLTDIYNKNKQNLDLLTAGTTTAVLLQKKLKAPADTSYKVILHLEFQKGSIEAYDAKLLNKRI